MEFIGQEKYSNNIGIYGIINTTNNKTYIGQTTESFIRRYWHHQHLLCNHSHFNKNLQKDWNLLGSNVFVFIPMCVSEKRELDFLEQTCIYCYKSLGESYNESNGGKGRPGTSMSLESRRRIGDKNREHNLGKKASMETRKRMSASSRHTPCSPEHKAILREYMSNRVVSNSTRKKLSEAFEGSKSNFAKINEDIAKQIKKYLIEGKSPKEISSMLQVGYQTVTAIRSGNTWKHVKVDGWDEWLEKYNSK